MEDQYNNFKREFTIISDHINEYKSFIQTLNKMKTYGFSVDQLVNQVNPHIEVNKNLYDQLKQNIQSYENNLLPGGSKKNNESYDQCAKRETKEETDVEIYELDLVTIYQGFRVFSDGKVCMFKCAVYFVLIGDQIPKQVETSNNNKWFSIELRDLEKYDLMDSLKEFKSIIVEKINNQVYKSDNPSIAPSEDEIPNSKIPSEEEILDDISKLVENLIKVNYFYLVIIISIICKTIENIVKLYYLNNEEKGIQLQDGS
ncbi:3757_t:CDS:2 [Gigaspora rosea]|nr:3757_t:CDS:2 [Gigaspora rosea]